MGGKKGHLIPSQFVYEGLLDWTKDKLRIELVLRSLELKGLNLDLGKNWNNETVKNVFSDYIGRMEMSQNTLLSDKTIMELPRSARSTYLLWKQGANMREVLPKTTFFRQRKQLLAYGVDINFYCESPDSNNVIPLVRTLEAKPAEIPAWMYEKGLIFDYNRPANAANY